MTTEFRIDRVSLSTTEGEVEYAFSSDLTVLVGPTTVGKTTLLELVKFGLGGKGRLSPVARDQVNAVTIDISARLTRESVSESSTDVTDQVGRFRITRSIDRKKRKKVQVWDLLARERMEDHFIDASEPSLNTLLMNAIGLPTDLRAAARSGSSTKAGPRVTFNDIFSFLYIPQYEMNRDIAKSTEGYQDPKRKTVFELLFEITDPELLEMRSRFNTLKKEIENSEREHATVLAFLSDSNIASREDTDAAIEAAVRDEQEAVRELDELEKTIFPVADRKLQVMRDLLANAERDLAEARSQSVYISRLRSKYSDELENIRSEVDRLERVSSASASLVDLEFVHCPRCMQSVVERHVPSGTCRLCLQDDALNAAGVDGIQYEISQMKDQISETVAQLAALESQDLDTANIISERERLVAELSAQIDTRTTERVTPRLQAYSDAAARLATGRALQEQLESITHQWDRVADLQAASKELRNNREGLRASLKEREASLESRKAEVLSEISEEFQRTVLEIGIPGVETAGIDSNSYLPLLNGDDFLSFSSAGGAITATQIAYWISLISVALRRRDTSYPAFLLIDSPRLALNDSESLERALYQRLRVQASVARGRLQIIIADNRIPSEYVQEFSRIDFDYDSPTIAPVSHPGRTNVSAISRETAEES